jgi:hypothetical protein
LKQQRKPVRDADRDYPWPVKIHKRHADKGIPRDQCKCAIALAINETTTKRGKPARAAVGKTIVLLEYSDEIVRYVLDENGEALVTNFDEHESFPLVSVRLKSPNPARRLGARPRQNRSDASWKRGPHERPFQPPTRWVHLSQGGS